MSMTSSIKDLRPVRRLRARGRLTYGRLLKLPPNLRGALWVMGSVVLFTCMQVLVKLMGNELHSFELAFFRALTGAVFITPFILRTGVSGFTTTRPVMMILRGIVGSTAMLCGFYAIANLPLAEATSLSFSRALFLVPLAAFFLGEAIGIRRITATVLGFVGVLIISLPPELLDPRAIAAVGMAAGPTLELGTIAAIGNAFFVAMAIIVVKILSRTDSTATLIFYSGMIGMITTAIPASLYWQWPTFDQYVLLFLMGGGGVAAHSCFIRAYRVGEASALAPLDYSRIIFSALAGYLIFATIPSWQTAVGAAVIAGSSLYITLREAQEADVETAPSDETGAPTEPLDYALKQREEKEMARRESGKG